MIIIINVVIVIAIIVNVIVIVRFLFPVDAIPEVELTPWDCTHK